MISKIIQFSTKQCGRCQQTKALIENKLKNSNIKYEYISLIDENKKVTDIKAYWDEVYTSFTEYNKKFDISLLRTLPSFLIEYENGKKVVANDRVIHLLLDEIN
jgi:glutaredoxin